MATSTLNGKSCSVSSGVITITVNDIAPGSIGTSQTICNGDDPAAFTSTVNATGSGVISYQWQSSTDNLTFTDIPGAVSSTYNAGVSAVTTYYKRVVTSTLSGKICSAESNVISVVVNDVNGGAIAADQTICSGDDPLGLSSTTDGSGSGTITYIWQSSTDNVSFNNIAGATLSTYDPPVQTQTMYFKRITISTLSGKACTSASNVVTITVNNVDAGVIAADQTICNGNDPAALTSTTDGPDQVQLPTSGYQVMIILLSPALPGLRLPALIRLYKPRRSTTNGSLPAP